ncbi:MAG: serine hydrolase [Granulosicoccaceae bacterium]
MQQDITGKPGTRWSYSGGAAALVAKLISKGAGKPNDEFAKEHLFGRLGIRKFSWIKGQDGEPSAASSLRMRAPDLGKAGQLVVDGGVHDGRQIVSRGAQQQKFQPRTRIDARFRYGHFWYLLGVNAGTAVAVAFGNGGHRLSAGLNAILSP